MIKELARITETIKNFVETYNIMSLDIKTLSVNGKASIKLSIPYKDFVENFEDEYVKKRTSYTIHHSTLNTDLGQVMVEATQLHTPTYKYSQRADELIWLMCDITNDILLSSETICTMYAEWDKQLSQELNRIKKSLTEEDKKTLHEVEKEIGYVW